MTEATPLEEPHFDALQSNEELYDHGKRCETALAFCNHDKALIRAEKDREATVTTTQPPPEPKRKGWLGWLRGRKEGEE